MSIHNNENTPSKQTDVPIPKPRRHITKPSLYPAVQTADMNNAVELTGVFTNPAIACENTEGISETLQSRDLESLPTVTIAKKDAKYPNKFYNTVIFLMELFSVHFADIFIKQTFPKTKKLCIQIPKRIIQVFHLIFFVILTIEGVRITAIENTKVFFTESGFEIGPVDMTAIILFIAYSVMSFFSLAFLYLNSDILRQTGVKFHTLTFKPLNKCIPNCILIFLYIALFILLAGTILWKLFLYFVFYRAFQFVDFRISIVITLTVAVYYMAMWYLSPLMLCFTIRSICKHLQHEFEDEIENTKQIIIGKINSDKNIYLSFYARLAHVYQISAKVRYIIALIILVTIGVSISISLSAFDETDGILTASRDNNINDKINKFDYLWLILSSYYFLFMILFMTQSISKLNSLINRFSELLLENKDVNQHLKHLAISDPQALNEIRENLHLISNSKIRFTAAFFGDFTSGLFYALMLPAMTFMVPFLLGLKYLFTHFNQVFSP